MFSVNLITDFGVPFERTVCPPPQLTPAGLNRKHTTRFAGRCSITTSTPRGGGGGSVRFSLRARPLENLKIPHRYDLI